MHGGSLDMLGKKKKMTESNFFRERIHLNGNGTCLMEPNLSNNKAIIES